MRAIMPEKGKVFRHKENKNIIRFFLFLKEGETIDDYEQVSIKWLIEHGNK
jgi:hypothetical protein